MLLESPARIALLSCREGPAPVFWVRTKGFRRGIQSHFCMSCRVSTRGAARGAKCHFSQVETVPPTKGNLTHLNFPLASDALTGLFGGRRRKQEARPHLFGLGGTLSYTWPRLRSWKKSEIWRSTRRVLVTIGDIASNWGCTHRWYRRWSQFFSYLQNLQPFPRLLSQLFL